MTAPNVTVEIAFDSGYQTAAVSRTWTDVTDYVEGQSIVNITRGRPDQFSAPQPSRLSLTLDNKDGRFTPENAAGAYYPNVKKGRPIRVRATTAGNMLTANQASNETSVAHWFARGGPAPTIARVAPGFDGSWSARSTWATGAGSGAHAGLSVSGLTVATVYTWSTYLLVPALNPDVYLAVEGLAGTSATMTTKDTWTRMSFTFTATATSHFLSVYPTVNAVAGQCYIDASQLETGTVASDFTTSGPTTYDRFLGYVDEWPVEWPDGSSAMSTVTISATSRQARLGRSAPFKSIVVEEYLNDAPTLYFPLGEPAGATEAGNIAPDRQDRAVVTQRGTGGTLVFGAGVGPGTDDLTAPVLTPASKLNALALVSTLAQPFVTGSTPNHIQVECWFVTSTSTSQGIVSLVSRDDSVTSSIDLVLDAGVVRATYGGLFGSPAASANSALSSADGLLHHAVAKASISAGTLTMTLILDGVVTVGGTTSLAAFPTFQSFQIGGAGTAPTTTFREFSGTLAHAAAYQQVSTVVTNARFQDHYTAGLNGFVGESSGARVARYARLAGIPTAEISAETGLSTSIAHKDTTGEEPIGLMQDVATTEDGVVFDGKDGTLTFHGRSHRYGAASAFTLSCTAGDVESGLKPTLDDQHLTNDMTASRAGGATIRSTDAASIAEYGYYKDTVEILTTSDNEVQSRADWEVNRFGTPRVTIPNLGVDLTSCSPALQAALLAADIGTKFTVTGLPSQAPASTMDFFIEGITEKIGAAAYGIEFNVSAAAYADVALWNSGVWDQSIWAY